MKTNKSQELKKLIERYAAILLKTQFFILEVLHESFQGYRNFHHEKGKIKNCYDFLAKICNTINEYNIGNIHGNYEKTLILKTSGQYQRAIKLDLDGIFFPFIPDQSIKLAFASCRKSYFVDPLEYDLYMANISQSYFLTCREDTLHQALDFENISLDVKNKDFKEMVLEPLGSEDCEDNEDDEEIIKDETYYRKKIAALYTNVRGNNKKIIKYFIKMIEATRSEHQQPINQQHSVVSFSTETYTALNAFFRNVSKSSKQDEGLGQQQGMKRKHIEDVVNINNPEPPSKKP